MIIRGLLIFPLSVQNVYLSTQLIYKQNHMPELESKSEKPDMTPKDEVPPFSL